MSLGLKRGTVQIETYDDQWPELFLQEKSLLISTLGDRVQAVEHVGSTSVPGLAAKPIIDIIAAVDSFHDLPYFIQRLEGLGYKYIPERMFADRKFFPKGPDEHRTHHLNLVLKTSIEQWSNILAFRDILKSDDALRDQYATLKKTLAVQFKNDRSAYTASKTAFINEVLNTYQ